MNTHPGDRSTTLTAFDLRCTLGGETVLSGVDVAVGAGELVTLVGPSGCGKSTLLRCLAGLVPLQSGSIEIAGREVTDVPAEKRQVGLVFRTNALFGHMRVARNVGFGLRHLPRRERAARVGEMLELVGLAGLARRYPHQLSGGEQQRVALARALAPAPAIVLLDEPFGALDEVFREELGWEVRTILADTDTAAILVTHDRREALSLGDRVAVMHDGRIVQCSSPAEVYRSPTDRFVADFIATSSHLPVTSPDGGLVRPHEVRVRAGGPCVVERVVFIGPAYRYTVRTPEGALLVSDVGPAEPLPLGTTCDVEIAGGRRPGFDRGRRHYHHAVTGRIIWVDITSSMTNRTRRVSGIQRVELELALALADLLPVEFIHFDFGARRFVTVSRNEVEERQRLLVTDMSDVSIPVAGPERVRRAPAGPG